MSIGSDFKVMHYPHATLAISGLAALGFNYARLRWILRQALRDPKRLDYTDPAITATSAADYDACQ